MEPSAVAAPRSNVPFSARWELLKPDLERLYLDEKRKLSEIIEIMKWQHGFDASQTQYKYQFGRKWGWRKNIPSSKKAAICERGQSRAALGKSTVAQYKGKDIDPKKLRRYAKTVARRETTLRTIGESAGQQDRLFGLSLPFGNRIFLNWNMPYGALGPLQSGADHPSPFEPPVSTPSDVSIMTTPPADITLSPRDAPSPLSVALKRKTAIERAHLFVQGKHGDLIRSMNGAERRVMSTWLYQFWLFSFRTAKYWGWGPRDWTADNLGFTTHEVPTFTSSPHTPNAIAPSPDMVMDWSLEDTAQKPSPFCHWSIHVEEVIYERMPFTNPAGPDPSKDGSWTEWPETTSFEEKLRNCLESNDFSNIKADQLPLAVPQIARAAKSSPNEFLEESLGFAIMGGNEDLVENLAEKARKDRVDISGLYPYHLATSYLGGSKSCCNVLDVLCMSLPFRFRIRELYVNRLGHTVLDTLMIAILKAHTSTLPGDVDDALKRESHFPGEEIDICGRWDADSDCYRALLASGKSSVPFEWKHKFCHTSVQAICHCIETISNHGANLSTPSGLFLRYCSHCGQKLQLLPLHALVLTAFQLAQLGCEGEDLFGPVACLLCLLKVLDNPHASAEISVQILLGGEQPSHCCHEKVTPLELVKKVPASITDKWPHRAKIGWQVFCHVLRIALETRASPDCECECDDYNDETAGDYHTDNEYGFWESTHLGHIWAATQTEMLTYRRLEDDDTWTSGNFDMADLLKSLEAGMQPSIGFIKKGLMKPYCKCGRFDDVLHIALREDTTVSYFSNLENWNRTTFINIPSRCRVE
ncbi:MAG: hypothetical protein M1840_008529 [Geoglossum simile]|nr:MAG: hypothetical protein M1840_008529 [Geoglossum simile]